MGRRDLHAIITGLKSSGRAILLTTHLIDEAHRLCDRIAILHQGTIRAIDTPEALIAGSSIPPRIIVRTKAPLAHDRLGALAGVTRAEFHDGSWRLETSQITQTLHDLMKLLQAKDSELLDLRIQRPTLEDVFIDLTGKPQEKAE
jgi:ABC-2 type transport system ATP-binding protein